MSTAHVSGSTQIHAPVLPGCICGWPVATGGWKTATLIAEQSEFKYGGYDVAVSACMCTSHPLNGSLLLFLSELDINDGGGCCSQLGSGVTSFIQWFVFFFPEVTSVFHFWFHEVLLIFHHFSRFPQFFFLLFCFHQDIFLSGDAFVGHTVQQWGRTVIIFSSKNLLSANIQKKKDINKQTLSAPVHFQLITRFRNLSCPL